MALYDQVGAVLVLQSEATFTDVVNEWRWNSASAKQTAKQRIGYGMLWWCDVEGERRLCDLAYVHADGGWPEIEAARRKLMGDERYKAASVMPV